MPAISLADDEHVPHRFLSSPVDRFPGLPPLPVYLTPFIGRTEETAQAIDLLRRDDIRLLTLTGPGGIGKTRLAVQIAAPLGLEFASGICFVPLSTISDHELVLPTIARALEIPELGSRPVPDMLKTSLQDRRFLLILDNFEQVIDAAVKVADLIAHCPKLKVIVTSRVVLHVQGEQEFAVPPLSTPARGPGRTWHAAPLDELSRYDAVTLFVQRAQSIQPAFSLTDDNALAVTEICTRLDGLPLAIELAAARIKILPPSALLTRLSNRLQVLTGGARDQPQRLRTMRDAIAWSHDLLDPAEQLLFQSLSVFAGGFTMEAAEAVVDEAGRPIDTLDGIASLVDSSLLREIDEPGSDRRFLMLSTIREYGLEQLANSHSETAARRRHADWCLSLAERAAPELGRAHVVTWLNRLEREHDNIRAALSWLLEQGDVESCQRMTSAIWMFWFFRSYFKDARTWFERILEQVPGTSGPSTGRTLAYAGLFAVGLADFAAAESRLEQSLQMARDLNDNECLAMALLLLGDVRHNLGDYERAEPPIQEAVKIFRGTDNHVLFVTSLALLGYLVHHRGENDTARILIDEGLACSRQTGFIWGTAICLQVLGRTAIGTGDYVQASRLFEESLSIWHELGDYWRMTRVLMDLAELAAAGRQFVRTARLLGAAEALNDALDVSSWLTGNTAHEQALALAVEHLDPESFADAWAFGRAMTWDETVYEAIASASIERETTRSHPDQPADRYGLTDREMEVLQLLAAGHSDRQIAEELFISRRTAQGHVASIFNKLGVNSRTAAATAALRAGLVSTEPSLS